MSIPRLPTELCERIIDVVASDSQFEESPSVLSSCALVSWRWVPRTRIHLYRQVILDSQTRAHKFLISLSLTPGLGQFVKTLVIDISRESRDPSHNWLYKAMGTLPGFLTHIQELKLWGLPLVQSVFMTLISQFVTVETLELYQLEYQSLAEIVRMINRFPKVQEVKLLGNSWKSPARYYSGRRLKFTGLEIRAPPRHSEDILKWAVKSRSAECLRTFRFHCTSPSSRFQERLEDVLWSCTRTLEKIALEVEPALLISLNNHSALRSFEFGGRPEHVFTMLTNLPTIAPPSLTAIRTEIHAPWTAVLDEGHNDDWAAIDQALSEPILEKLERFEIWCYSSREGFNPMDILRLKLPRLFKRGILWWHPFSTDPDTWVQGIPDPGLDDFDERKVND